MSRPCGCCATCRASSAERLRNRPGLDRLQTRIGTHGTFFEEMAGRLSADDAAPLGRLKSRRQDDPAIALLDAWAVVADVLTFYQERIANEGYLRTATERRSLIEIGRLIGYRPRPGVAATAHLAFTLENESEPADIEAGTRVNSIPAPGEKMVAFETTEAIRARREWNAIKPRTTRPQTVADFQENGGLYVKGTKTRLKPTDAVILKLGANEPELRFIRKIVEDPEQDQTFVLLDVPRARKLSKPGGDIAYGISLPALSAASALTPPNSAALSRSLKSSFKAGADTLPRLLSAVRPALGNTLYRALRNVPPPPPPPGKEVRLYAMRVNARPFGHNAPQRLVGMDERVPVLSDWPPPLSADAPPGGHGERDLYLDNEYEILPDSMIAIAMPGKKTGDNAVLILNAPELEGKEGLVFTPLSLNAYGMSGKSVLVHWEDGPKWLGGNDQFIKVRRTRVFAASEELELAEAPITSDIAEDRVELDGVYEGLEAGRWLIVEGERSDILDVNGVALPGMNAAELVMLQGVEQSVAPLGPSLPPVTGAPAPAAPAEKLRTVISFAGQAGARAGLAYRYKRDTVRIHGNVARATHGETRTETLGDGDSSKSLQTFVLKQPPLTHVSAETPSGTASTLEIRVNELLWREAPSIAGLGPTDRCYLTRDDDEGITSIVFGNGVRGARPPSGRENVKALYRNGIGRSGNVPAGRLSLLATRPLGLKGVINPLPASGGADSEGLLSIRRNAPIALMALDRLVSTPDYANFARAFGGIGKANAIRAGDQDVDVVVAGIDDIPIAPDAELPRNLAAAMRRFGDPQVVVRVTPRERLVLVIQANVLVEPDRSWALVEPKVRAALLDEFGFERIGLGESLTLGRALKAIQAVEGVVYADIDLFDSIAEDKILEGITGKLGEGLSPRDLIRVEPNQIAYLAADVPDTLILQEIKP